MFNRAIDNTKVLEATGIKREELTPLRKDLKMMLDRADLDAVSAYKPVDDAMDEYLGKM